MKSPRIRADLRIALWYAIFGGLWVTFSDHVLAAIITDVDTLTRINTYQGWAFVAASALLIFILLRREVFLSSIATHQVEEKLHEQEESFKQVWEVTSDGMCLSDPDGIVLAANPSYFKIYGYTAEQVIGKSFEIIFPESEREQALEQYKMIFQSENVPPAYESLIQRADGTERIVEAHISFITNAGKRSIMLSTICDITDRKKYEEALHASEAQFTNALKIAHAGHWEYDVASDTFTFNDNFYQIFRSTAEEAGGYQMLSAEYARKFCHPDDVHVVQKEIVGALETTDPHYSRQLEHRILRADGETGYITVRFFIVKDAEGHTIKLYGVNQDITERKQAEKLLHNQSERQGLLYKILREVGDKLDADIISQIGVEAILRLQRWPSASISLMEENKKEWRTRAVGGRLAGPIRGPHPLSKGVTGRVYRTGLTQLVPDVRKDPDYWKGANGPVFSELAVPIHYNEEVIGSLNLESDQVSDFTSEDVEMAESLADVFGLAFANAHQYSLAQSEIHDRKQAEASLERANQELFELQDELREQAIHDPLTGLFNRRFMQEKFTQEFARAKRENYPLSVIMMDMDELKFLNDTYGHQIGDLALKTLADCLKQNSRISDSVFRYGGDEFNIVMSRADGDDALRRVDEWRQYLLDNPIKVNGTTSVPIKFSAGVAYYPRHGVTIDDLTRNADAALYQAKQNGRNKVCLAQAL